MKFQLVTPDHDYSSAFASGCVNGGTTWLHNIADAIRFYDHEAEIRPINQGLSADYVIVQSEAMMHTSHLGEYAKKGKVICLLGHFEAGPYAPLSSVKEWSKFIFTPWEGECLTGTDHHLFPHAYNDLHDERKSIKRGSIIFDGNSYSLRSEEWFKGLDITRIYGTLPKEMLNLYRGADVCLNLHGDFQKNKVVEAPNRLSGFPGMMINERFWNVLGAGGLLITDWVDQMGRWFDKSELIFASSKEEYQELVTYYVKHKAEGLYKLRTAIEKVRKHHTYKDRVQLMLKTVC